MKVLIDSVINHYEKYIHPNFPSKKVSYTDYEKEIDSVLGFYFLEFKEEGRSIENRPIHSIKFGTGKRKTLIWTQMHGNEASATRALFDVFNALNDKQNEDLKDLLSNELQILFVPMLNPDGAERYQRRNAIDIDPNRDAAKKNHLRFRRCLKSSKISSQIGVLICTISATFSMYQEPTNQQQFHFYRLLHFQMKN